MNLATHKIIITRDITFHEKHLPYFHSPTRSQPPPSIFLPSQIPFPPDTSCTLLDSFPLDTPTTCSSTNYTIPSSTSTPSSSSLSLPTHLTIPSVTSTPSPNTSTSSLTHITSSHPPLRQSTRIHKQSAWFTDYVVVLLSILTSAMLFNLMNNLPFYNLVISILLTGAMLFNLMNYLPLYNLLLSILLLFLSLQIT